MHTFNGDSCNIHYNSDFSGEAIIYNKNDHTEIRVDSQDLINFVSEYVRSKKVSQLDNMNSDDILRVD